MSLQTSDSLNSEKQMLACQDDYSIPDRFLHVNSRVQHMQLPEESDFLLKPPPSKSTNTVPTAADTLLSSL